METMVRTDAGRAFHGLHAFYLNAGIRKINNAASATTCFYKHDRVVDFETSIFLTAEQTMFLELSPEGRLTPE